MHVLSFIDGKYPNLLLVFCRILHCTALICFVKYLFVMIVLTFRPNPRQESWVVQFIKGKNITMETLI